jgi:hypothetical protein
MEADLTNKFIDIEIYERSTGNLVLTQRCPTSATSKFLTQWIYRDLNKMYRANISSKVTRSCTISSFDFPNITKFTDYNFSAN